MPTAGVSIVTLGVSDLARARDYYQALGWKLSSSSTDGIAFLQGRNLVLALYGRQALAEDAQVDVGEGGFDGITLACNCRSEVEVDELFARALAAGGRATKMPQPVFWGGYSGYVADPDGHLWEYAFNPFVSFNDAGDLVLAD